MPKHDLEVSDTQRATYDLYYSPKTLYGTQSLKPNLEQQLKP